MGIDETEILYREPTKVYRPTKWSANWKKLNINGPKCRVECMTTARRCSIQLVPVKDDKFGHSKVEQSIPCLVMSTTPSKIGLVSFELEGKTLQPSQKQAY